MAAWMSEFSLSLEEILLPTLSIWEVYHPMLGIRELRWLVESTRWLGSPTLGLKEAERFMIAHGGLPIPHWS